MLVFLCKLHRSTLLEKKFNRDEELRSHGANSLVIKKIMVALVNEVRHDRDRDSAITVINQC